jgi:hypothetical protein
MLMAMMMRKNLPIEIPDAGLNNLRRDAVRIGTAAAPLSP